MKELSRENRRVKQNKNSENTHIIEKDNFVQKLNMVNSSEIHAHTSIFFN